MPTFADHDLQNRLRRTRSEGATVSAGLCCAADQCGWLKEKLEWNCQRSCMLTTTS